MRRSAPRGELLARAARAVIAALATAAGAATLTAATAGCGGGDDPMVPPVVAEGAPCATVGDCGDALLCVLGRCRAECTGWIDCAIGSACLEDPESGERGCRVEDEASCAGAADCPEGTECQGGTCRARCTSAGACGGTACAAGGSGSLCVDPGDTHDVCEGDTAYCASGVCADFGCDFEVGVALGDAITCVVRDSGAVDCAGSDAGGQLGDGPTEPAGGARATLAPVALTEPAQFIGAGEAHACAALFGSEVHCWGAAGDGQTGAAGATDAPALAIAAPSDESGTIDELAIGARHGCLRRASGAVECWGSDAVGQLGDAAEHAACASGLPCSAEPVAIEGVADAVDLGAGREATCAVLESGPVVCWGRADTGLFGEGGATGAGTCTLEGGASVACVTTPTEVVGISHAFAVAVGDGHACAIDEDGVVWCWGRSDDGQAGVAGGVAPVTEIVLPLGAASIAVGRAHGCAATVDGVVWCWGANDVGQLGDPSGASGSATPVAVSGVPRAYDVASGRDHACAFTTDGEIWCWGRDDVGQLARGAPSASAPPAAVGRE